MSMPARSPGLLITLLAVLGVAACAETTTAPVLAEPEELIGIWRSTVPGVSETTFEFEDGQAFNAVYADYVDRQCTTESGSWSVTGGVLTLNVTQRNGQLVSSSPESVAYERSGNIVTISAPAASEGTYGRASSLPICADYGWMSMVMFAEIDGVLTDLSWRGLFEPNLGSGLSDGFVSIAGYHDPDGAGLDPTCATCALLTIDLFHELGVALTPGTYPVETFGPTGLRSEAQYRPSYANTSTSFGTNDSDPTLQPWSGQVLVTTMNEFVAEGNFEFALYDATGTGPPYPSVTITNGSFRLSFD